MSERQSASQPIPSPLKQNDAALPAVSHSVKNDLRFLELLLWNARASRSRGVLWACIVAMPAAYVLFLVSHSALIGGIAYGAAAIAGMLIYGMWRGYYANLHRMKNITTTITPKYLSSRVEASGSELRYDWTRVKSVNRIGEILVFEIDNRPGSSLCIPFRCFKNRRSAQEFLQYSMQYWKEGQVRRHALGMCVVADDADLFSRRTAMCILLGTVVLLVSTVMLSDFHGMSRVLFWVLLLCCGISFPIMRGLGQNPQQFSVPAGVALGKDNDPGRALTIANRGLHRFPNDPELGTLAAFAAYRMDNVDEGMFYVERALQSHPRNAALLAARAFGLRENCKPESALADLYASAEIDPYIFWAMSLRAGVLLDLSRYQDAIKVALEASELDQRGMAPPLMIAWSHAMMNDFKNAYLGIAHAEAILSQGGLSPRERSILLSTNAAVYAQAGDLELAAEQAARAIDADPTFSGGYSERGYISCLQGKPKAAAGYLERADSLKMTKRQRVALQMSVALWAIVSDRIEIAQKITTTALTTVTNPFTLTYRALSLVQDPQRIGIHYTDAILLCNKAIEIDPYNRLAYWVRHRAEASLGYKEAAVRDLSIATGFGFRPFIE